MNRRAFLRRLGVLGGTGLVSPSFLAACVSEEPLDPLAVRFDNWPAYIDEETVDLFIEESGLRFTYNESFNDNYEYFARVVGDLLVGRDIGADIIAPTYWLAARFIQLEFVQPLPLDLIPNRTNLVADLRDPSWDPTGEYSLPWQSGMTGIAYNLSATGRDLTSMQDLFDPEFAGRIGMLTEMRDTVGLMMLATGVDPAEATVENSAEAFERLQRAKDDGTIRQFTGNDYMDDLASGNFAACIGWSGDISQLALDNPDLRFVVPEEGGMRWSDTMVIPSGAPNVENAAAWMDYVYDPVNAARIAAYVGYISPVDGVQEILAESDDEFEQALAESPLMFPDEETLDRLHVFASLPEDDEAAFDERFSRIVGA